MTLSFTNSKGYIFIVRRLEKQSKLIFFRLDSISNLKLNLRIHGLCGPDAHAGADLQVFLIYCFKTILLSAHKLPLLIYGDNRVKPSLCCESLGVSWLEESLQCAASASLLYLKGGAYMTVGSPTGGPNDLV